MFSFNYLKGWGPLYSWSYGNWIYNYLCNQCLSPLKLWVRIPLMARCTWTTLCQKVSDLRQICGFLRVLLFSPPIKLTKYDWNIVESGIKHHNPTRILSNERKIILKNLSLSNSKLKKKFKAFLLLAFF